MESLEVQRDQVYNEIEKADAESNTYVGWDVTDHGVCRPGGHCWRYYPDTLLIPGTLIQDVLLV